MDPKLDDLDKFIKLIRESNKILVITGAGISVSAGIPDFRSENGLYNQIRNLKKTIKKDINNPTDIFDLKIFEKDPSIFYSFAHLIYSHQLSPSSSIKPTITHKFIKLLEINGKLLRNYTQNIDTLEQKVNIENLIYAHGNNLSSTCLKCKKKSIDFEHIKNGIKNKIPVKCTKCKDGYLKPDIVFFGEDLPKEYFENIDNDKNNCDLLVVIGTSLNVKPISLIPSQVPKNVPRILINKEKIDKINFELEIYGECDSIFSKIINSLNDDKWNLKNIEYSEKNEKMFINKSIKQNYDDCDKDNDNDNHEFIEDLTNLNIQNTIQYNDLNIEQQNCNQNNSNSTLKATSPNNFSTKTNLPIYKIKNDNILFEITSHNKLIIPKEKLDCLNDGNFLNDFIIEFYLNYIKLITQKSLTGKIYIFTPFFFAKMLSIVDGELKDEKLYEKQYNQTKNMIKNEDIFNYDYLIVPIFKNKHWSLALICFPGKLIEINMQNYNLKKEIKSDSEDKPCIIFMDSMGRKELLFNDYFIYLQNFLKNECNEKKKLPINFSDKQMLNLNPKVPIQSNNYDCGIFLFHYVEQFLKDPKEIIKKIISTNELEDWFNLDELKEKRKFIFDILFNIYEQNLRNKSNANLDQNLNLNNHDHDNEIEILEYNNLKTNIIHSYSTKSNALDVCKKEQLSFDEAYDNDGQFYEEEEYKSNGTIQTTKKDYKINDNNNCSIKIANEYNLDYLSGLTQKQLVEIILNLQEKLKNSNKNKGIYNFRKYNQNKNQIKKESNNSKHDENMKENIIRIKSNKKKNKIPKNNSSTQIGKRGRKRKKKNRRKLKKEHPIKELFIDICKNYKYIRHANGNWAEIPNLNEDDNDEVKREKQKIFMESFFENGCGCRITTMVARHQQEIMNEGIEKSLNHIYSNKEILLRQTLGETDLNHVQQKNLGGRPKKKIKTNV